MSARIRKWVGGYVRRTRDGREVYVIEKWWGGARLHVSTRCSTELAAVKELARFEIDPIGYRPGGAQQLLMTAELMLEYRDHQEAKKLSPEWVDEVSRCLAAWATAIGRRDLRTLNLHRDLKPLLATWPTQRPHRIKALKGFFRWLRQERGLITHAQDATLDLKVPQSKPEKWTRRKVVGHEDVAAVLQKLKQPTRDVLHLLTATAWHLSEARRFAEGGELVVPTTGESLAVLITRHKSGRPTRTGLLFLEHVEAAKRLRARGCLPKRMTLARHMQKACDDASVPRFALGQMRHSVLTWARERGASFDDLADFAQHQSSSTTRRFYVDSAEPTKRVPILRLLN